MNIFTTDRDSLFELFDIVSDCCAHHRLAMTNEALKVISSGFSLGADIYLRRRLSVCRMLCDLNLPMKDSELDILLGAALCHSLPGDFVPPGHLEKMKHVFSCESRVDNVLSILRHTDYSDKTYYTRVIRSRDALMIRLIERAVLVEKLYEWPPQDAFRFINETRDYFFPMCVYAKEHYPEFAGQVTLVMEKMRSLISANEILLRRFEDSENALNMEILDTMEENASLRMRINELNRLKTAGL